MSWSVINSELIVLPDLATKVRECFKMPLKIFGGSANIWVGGNLFHNKLHHKTTQLFCFPDDSKAPVIEKEKNVFLTPCCQLWTFANTFVVVCILCTEITSWLPNAAYFACCSTVAFKVYPVEWQRKNEGRGGGSPWLLFLKRQRPTRLNRETTIASLLLDLE